MKNLILLLIAFFTAGGAFSQSKRIGQHDAITTWKIPSNNFATVSEGKQIAQQIIDVVGLKPNFEVQAANIPNAAAVTYNGKRYILYNPSFIKTITRATGTKWAAISILAHEIGHHLNGHALSNSGSQHTLELDADEFSGFALKKMGASLAEAQIAMKVAASERASKTHPGQYDRLIAIQRGWERAGGKVEDDIASNQRNQPQRQTTSRRSTVQTSPIASKYILGDVRFHADPRTRYYVTTQYNLVKVVNNRLSVVGKLAAVRSSQYPYVIHDNETHLLVDKRGNILTRRGQAVGQLTSRS